MSGVGATADQICSPRAFRILTQFGRPKPSLERLEIVSVVSDRSIVHLNHAEMADMLDPGAQLCLTIRSRISSLSP